MAKTKVEIPTSAPRVTTASKTARQKAKLEETIRRIPELIGRDDPELIKAMTGKK